MDIKNGAWILFGMCVLILVVGVLKRKAEILLNFMMRMVVGLIGIYFFNKFLDLQGISAFVGLNPLNALTVGSLGTGGFALLYGIAFYSLL